MKLWSNVSDKRPAQSTFVERATQAVPDRLMADLAGDARLNHPLTPSSIVAEKAGPVQPRKGGGSVPLRPFGEISPRWRRAK
jgi:hypothetical protein